MNPKMDNEQKVVGIHPGSIPESAAKWAWIGHRREGKQQVYFSFNDGAVGAAKALKPVSLYIALESLDALKNPAIGIAYTLAGRWPLVFTVQSGILIPKDGDIKKAYEALECQTAQEGTWLDELARRNGVIKNTLGNLSDILLNDDRWAGVLGFNQFERSLIKLKSPPFETGMIGAWTDNDSVETSIWMEKYYGMTPTTSLINDAIGAIARRNAFHPVRDYLNGLEWDGMKRLETWAVYYLDSEDNEYTRLVSKAWLIGAVARIMKPGCKMDNVLILEGKQGIGKSRSLSILAKPWHLDTALDLSSKDFVIAMQGKWIIEMGELDTLNKTDSNRAKQFFSLESDTFRAPYEAHAEKRLRECVFAGSVNSAQYLKDETGGRRYWPIRCRSIDTASLEEVRDQLWAEALVAYRAGEPWWLDHTLECIQHEQESRYMVDAWEEVVTRYLDQSGHTEVSTSQILGEVLELKVERWDRASQMRVGNILTRLGFVRRMVRVGKKTVWRYMKAST